MNRSRIYIYWTAYFWRCLMNDSIIRLSSLTLENIKNVRKGTVCIPMTDITKAGVLGIYGQNGSGKTAVIDALYFLHQIMIGSELGPELADYMDSGSDHSEITAEFIISCNENTLYEVGYHVHLAKADSEIWITREFLNCSVTKNGIRSNKNIFMDYQREASDNIFKPQKRLDELVSQDKNLFTDLIVARKIAEKSNCSYIFGESSREVFCRSDITTFENYSFVIRALFRFAVRDLFVIRNTHSRTITANFMLPMVFRIEKDQMRAKGDFAIPLMTPVTLDKERKELLRVIVERINTVLYTIIPGMNIELRDYGRQALDSGEDGWKVELMSARAGHPTIPIRMESEGIIKIISILNALIQAFGNPSICLAIDELDADIFEYMLGELLDIFQNSAKGQLIFTSHNLRALEMLDKESIMFSTTNPENRYIHMKNVKGSNNLRSMYIRSITLGGQDEVIYDETDSLEIARAFRKAGRSMRNH